MAFGGRWVGLFYGILCRKIGADKKKKLEKGREELTLCLVLMAEVTQPRLPKHWETQWDTSGSGHPLATLRARWLFLSQGVQQTAALDGF